ncbi:hypothetical protein [Lactococcus termiticola]|nr:hypothetical protein [Lactococcus termiticola]
MLFFASSIFTSLHGSADELQNRHQVDFTFTSTGIPNKNRTYIFLNYAKAYEKIKNGDFSDKDMASSSYQEALQQAPNPAGPNFISVSYPDVYIGPGKKFNDFQTQGILTKLIQGRAKLIQSLNETSSGTINTYQAPKNQFRGFQGKVTSKKFTDASGRLSANLPDGPTVIIDANGGSSDSPAVVGFVNINSDTKKQTIDTLNPSSDISLKVENLDGKTKGAADTYVVGIGDNFTYHLQISSEQLSANNTVTLTFPANIILDNPPAQLGEAIIPSTNPNVKSYQFAVAPQDSDLTMDINAHIGPMDPGVAFYQNNTNTIYTASAQALSDYSTVNAQSESVTTSGINFAMADAKKEKLVQGASYILGKVVNGQNYLYNKSGQWTLVSSLDQLNPTNFLLLDGGNRYVISQTAVHPIPFNSQIIGFNTDRAKQVNASLIQIYGLGKSNDYFLKEVTAADGYALQTKTSQFSVDWSKKLSPNDGRFNIESSISRASVQSSELNQKIDDYATGYNEYHVLDVSQSNSKQALISWGLIKGIALILGMVIIMLVAMLVILVRKK